ncbi:MAG: DUF3089 domain-containing protein [Caulobacteraceae bacterium]|nr:MAG: DUF3089 domain-containing protein [Caulobacteraceae bacterium]
MRWVHWLTILMAAVVMVLATAAYYWRDDIFEHAIDPGIPYFLYKPPAAPDYRLDTTWALRPAKPQTWTSQDPDADVFFIHPTTFTGDRWNARIDNQRSRRLLDRIMIPNWAGPFATSGRVFAPRYRQANLYSMLTLREDAREARAYPYRDIKAAFDLYMRDWNKGRPIIIVGVEQGGVLADRLVRDEIASNPERLKQLVAAYVIEAGLAPEHYAPNSAVPACMRRDQAGCMVSWMTEGYSPRRTRDKLRHAPVWERDQLVELLPRKPLCVNPLLGAATVQQAPRKMNLGAANASRLEWGVQPGFLSDEVGAQCVDGLLHVTRPKSRSLRTGSSWGERMQAPAFNLFYADLQADAKTRLAVLMGGAGKRAPPVSDVIEIKPSRTRF